MTDSTLNECIKDLFETYQESVKISFKNVKEKYAGVPFLKVSTIEPPSSISLLV